MRGPGGPGEPGPTRGAASAHEHAQQPPHPRTAPAKQQVEPRPTAHDEAGPAAIANVGWSARSPVVAVPALSAELESRPVAAETFPGPWGGHTVGYGAFCHGPGGGHAADYDIATGSGAATSKSCASTSLTGRTTHAENPHATIDQAARAIESTNGDKIATEEPAVANSREARVWREAYDAARASGMAADWIPTHVTRSGAYQYRARESVTLGEKYNACVQALEEYNIWKLGISAVEAGQYRGRACPQPLVWRTATDFATGKKASAYKDDVTNYWAVPCGPCDAALASADAILASSKQDAKYDIIDKHMIGSCKRHHCNPFPNVRKDAI